MAWERRVNERIREEKKYQDNTRYGENINQSAGVSATMSGGLSFCPHCGSMMLESHGIFKCRGCGYSESSETQDSSSYNNYTAKRRIKRQPRQILKEHETREEMNEFLRVMRRGKTRSQAAEISGIPLSRVNHWYHEGEWGTNRNVSHFYRELKSIEQDQERRKREEIDRQNRLRQQERERKQRIERQRQERLRKQKSENKIKNQMNRIISLMEKGKNRKQAAMYLGIPVREVNEWFDKGSKRKGQIYLDFYNKVSTIEIRQKKESSSVKSSRSNNYKKCINCGHRYNSSFARCPKCGLGSKATIKPKSSKSSFVSSDNRDKQMEKLISLMEAGSSRNEAADKLGISVITVNNWYSKGSRGDSDYIEFYENVKNIEATKNKYKSTSAPKITSKSVSKSKTTTKSKKSNSLSGIKYCQNCGKKIDKDDLIYCSKCGASIKTGKKTTAGTTSSNNDSFDWKYCCVIVFIIFIMIVFLSMI